MGCCPLPTTVWAAGRHPLWPKALGRRLVRPGPSPWCCLLQHAAMSQVCALPCLPCSMGPIHRPLAVHFQPLDVHVLAAHCVDMQLAYGAKLRSQIQVALACTYRARPFALDQKEKGHAQASAVGPQAKLLAEVIVDEQPWTCRRASSGRCVRGHLAKAGHLLVEVLVCWW